MLQRDFATLARPGMIRKRGLARRKGDEDRDRRRRDLRIGHCPPAPPRARDHRVRGGLGRPAGTRTPSASTPSTRRITWTRASSSSTTATIPNFERLLRSVGVPWQPSDMSFGVSDGGDFEYNGSSPNGLFAKRAHLVTPWFHRMIADLVRFNRDALAAAALRRRGSFARALARRAGVLAAVRGAADRAAGLGRVVGRPAPDVDVPGALPGRVLRQPRDARVRQAAGVADDRRRVALLRGRGVAAVARPPAGGDADRGDHPRRRFRRDHAARRRAGALRSRRARHALRPGAADARRRLRSRARDPRGDPVPAQRGRPAHGSHAAAAAPAGVGLVELPPARQSRPG